MTYRAEDLPRTGRTKHQREAAARQLAQIPEELRPSVRECLEAVWRQEDREIGYHVDDLKTRKLVGARVPREFAERISNAAAANDLTVYAWVIAAFTAKLAEDERPPWA